MFNESNDYSLKKIEERYKREVSSILFELNYFEQTVFSVFDVVLSKKKENLKVYLFFSSKEKKKEILNALNNKFLLIIKKKIAKTGKFTNIPKISFFTCN